MSQGLYAHTTRATGTLLTASIYNGDHQNHIANHNPSMMGALSDTVTQMQEEADPGGIGSESLASSLADEIRRIRFVLRAIGGGSTWYDEPGNTFIAPAGTVVDYAGNNAPDGWLLCDGSAVSRTTFSRLFSAIGTIYGAGNGSTTFNLPDCRGRVVAGRGNMGGTSSGRITSSGAGSPGINGNNLGAAGGEDRHTLTVAQMPQHNHSFSGSTNTTGNHSHTYTRNAGSGAAGIDGPFKLQGTTSDDTSTAGAHSHSVSGSIGNAGSTNAHPNVQPTIIMNKIIRT